MQWQPRPDTHAARIVEYLRANPGGASDSELERALGNGVSHATVNMRCRDLERHGLLVRRRIAGLTRNILVTDPVDRAINDAVPDAPFLPESRVIDDERPWYWEGNVQATIVRFLVEQGWSITRVANTATREAGKDIEASRAAEALWVTVKGFPQGTERTTPSTQARIWFQAALLDVILWREESRTVSIAVGVPRRATYQNLAARIGWFQRAAGFSYLWVTEDRVERE